jgi:hypothetical protein
LWAPATVSQGGATWFSKNYPVTHIVAERKGRINLLT